MNTLKNVKEILNKDENQLLFLIHKVTANCLALENNDPSSTTQQSIYRKLGYSEATAVLAIKTEAKVYSKLIEEAKLKLASIAHEYGVLKELYWIDINDRLPDDNVKEVDVWCFSCGHGERFSNLKRPYDKTWKQYFFWKHNRYTHWMKATEGPKEKE